MGLTYFQQILLLCSFFGLCLILGIYFYKKNRYSLPRQYRNLPDYDEYLNELEFNQTYHSHQILEETRLKQGLYLIEMRVFEKNGKAFQEISREPIKAISKKEPQNPVFS